MDNTEFAKRMKLLESNSSCGSFQSGTPFVIRLDGRSFSRFTKDLTKPFDENVIHVMNEVTKTLVEDTGAILGYTQSDEITLVFGPDNEYFGRKIYKFISVTAGIASAKFNQLIPHHLPEREGKLAIFDSRLILPNKDLTQNEDDIETSNLVLWRVHDSYRNAVSIIAHTMFGHKKLCYKSVIDKIKMIEDELGNTLENTYNMDQLYGRFFKRIPYFKEVDGDQVIRTTIDKLDLDIPFSQLSLEDRIKICLNRIEVDQ